MRLTHAHCRTLSNSFACVPARPHKLLIRGTKISIMYFHNWRVILSDTRSKQPRPKSKEKSNQKMTWVDGSPTRTVGFI